MAKYRILSWHGIPVQVRAQDTSGRFSKKLDDRFMQAVDQAAMASKHVEGELYTEGFVWGDWHERDGTAEEVADAICEELESQHPEIDYRAVANKLKEQKHSGEEE